MNTREKGLSGVREVRHKLEELGHLTEGPAVGTAFFDGRVNLIHRDYFGAGDLISYYNGEYLLHQVTSLENKSPHVRTIQGKGLSALLWCRILWKGRIAWRVFEVKPDTVEEIDLVLKGQVR